MRQALRRILWFLPTLVVVTVLAFGAVAGAFEEPAATGEAAKERGSPGALFFNADPVDVSDLSWRAVLRISAGTPTEASQAAHDLVQLGAAALPHIMGRLDGINPEGRRRVALALLPLAERIGVDHPPSAVGGAQVLRFWTRFWEDHSVDFKPIIARRVVRRYATRATDLRERELLQLDTYALAEIIQQMQTTPEPQAVRRLIGAATHITAGQKDAPGAASGRLDTQVQSWQAWWSKHRHNYVRLQGFERLLLPILQTRYATWAKEAARSRFGTLRDGRPALNVFRDVAPLTAGLLLTALVGGTLVGILLGTLLQWSPRRRLRTALQGLMSLTVLSSVVVLVGAAVHHAAPARTLLAFALMLVLGATLAGRHQAEALGALRHKAWMHTYRACGVSEWRLVWLTLRPSCGATVSNMATHTTTLLSGVFLIEYALQLEGAGGHTILALHQRDLTWLMLVTLATATLVSLVQLASTAAVELLEPWRTTIEQYD